MIHLPSPALIGVIHLPALPGSPAHQLSMDEIIDRALRDGHTLRKAGFDAVIVENFGDQPLPQRSLSSASLAALAVATDRLRKEVKLPVGVNALRNDAIGALGIAAASGAGFIRVNIHTGVAATDQGMIEGQAEKTLRYRKLLSYPVAVLADVHVKHAVPLSQPDLARAAQETAYRGLADGLIVTGSATGEAVVADDVRTVVQAVPDRRVFVGSGATLNNIGELLRLASGVIVGTSIKERGETSGPVDADRARAFVGAARE